jgi:hypothetical protein
VLSMLVPVCVLSTLQNGIIALRIAMQNHARGAPFIQHVCTSTSAQSVLSTHIPGQACVLTW